MPKLRAYKTKLTAEQVTEICALYKDPDITREHIQESYKLTAGELTGLLDDMGCVTPRKSHDEKPKSITLDSVMAQRAEVQRKRDELDKELARLRDLQENLSIRFEWEGDDVHVYGITSVPMIADKRQWLSFLHHDGARKLREFINAKNVH